MSFGFTSSIKNGKRVSSWVRYRDNGQLWSKGEYNKYGELEGEWFHYWDNGQLWSKGEHNKNGNKEGEWVFYNKDGTFDFKMTF